MPHSEFRCCSLDAHIDFNIKNTQDHNVRSSTDSRLLAGGIKSIRSNSTECLVQYRNSSFGLPVESTPDDLLLLSDTMKDFVHSSHC